MIFYEQFLFQKIRTASLNRVDSEDINIVIPWHFYFNFLRTIEDDSESTNG